jgi:glycosyltransferase involved in cell wall biosynthesis
MPAISVVIPVFNGEKTIRETVNSVLNQTFSDFELIVINDGSTDSTLEILDSIQDSRLKVISYSNAGLAASRNRGITHATGEFISFLDADDLWLPEKLAEQLKALQTNPEAAVAYSWTDYINAESQFLQSGSHISVSGDVFSKLIVINFIESGSNVLIRKSALNEVGNFDEALTAAEDWDMFLRLAARYHFVAVPLSHILYRRTNSMSSNVTRQENECLKVLERAYVKAPASLQHLRQKSLANLYKYLTFKALEGPPGRRKGLEAARCLFHTVRNNPYFLKQTRVILSLLYKISAIALLSPHQSERVLGRVKLSRNA